MAEQFFLDFPKILRRGQRRIVRESITFNTITQDIRTEVERIRARLQKKGTVFAIARHNEPELHYHMSTPVPGPTTAAGATSPALDEGLAGLLNYQIPLSQIGTVSSSICVQRDDSFTTYLADLEATPIFMELNLFQTKNYVACQDGRNRWRLATKRVKVPLTAVEEMAIASLLDKVANRIKNSSSLQLKQGTRTSSQ